MSIGYTDTEATVPEHSSSDLLPAGAEPDRAFPIDDLLRLVHARSSNDPIRAADENGAFPSSLWPAAPIVPDTNELRGDILYACRNQRRTVLVNAANTGAVRLYCARHVLDEIEEHAAEWTATGRVSTGEFLGCWRANYLPLIRVVDVPDDLLHPDEAARIERLQQLDPDDVPSATLALVLEAFYLSKDRRAVQAVYGAGHDLAEHTKWLEVLVACGDAGELGELLYTTALVGGLTGDGLVRAAKRLATDAPWIAVPLAVGVGYLIAQWKPEYTRRLRHGLAATLRVIGDLAVAQHDARSRFLAAASPTPRWCDLAPTIEPMLVLVRACTHSLARSPRSNHSARDLSAALPSLPVACGEAKVRAALRGHECFNEVYYGRYQLGAGA